jgi:perosamine synthetase
MIPPTGHKLYIKDFFPANRTELSSGFWFSSGTGALCFLVQNLKIPPRSKIVIPAYTCPSVAAAVIKSGHSPVLCDVSLQTLNYDLDLLSALINREDPAAVIWVNLFGMITRIPKFDLPVITDNAQVYYSEYADDRSVAEIYSFGRGKPLNAMSGGVAIVHNTTLFANPENSYQEIPLSNIKDHLNYLIKIMGYLLFYRPNLYGIPVRIPWLKIGDTIFQPDFDLKKIGSVNLKILKGILARFTEIKKMRLNLCKTYLELCDYYKEHINIFNVHDAFRFPVIIKHSALRDKIISKMVNAGISASGMYPQPLNKQAGLEELLNDLTFYNNAEYVSKNLLVLPINEYVDDRCIAKTKEIFDEFFI